MHITLIMIMKKCTALLALCLCLFLLVSCVIDDPDLHAYIGFTNNADIPIALSFWVVKDGALTLSDWKELEQIDELEKEWFRVQERTKRIRAPHTRTDNYCHYEGHPSIWSQGWETTGMGILYIYVIDGSLPNEDVRNKEYGIEKLLGIYKLYPNDLKAIDFHIVYPPDETYSKFWITPK